MCCNKLNSNVKSKLYFNTFNNQTWLRERYKAFLSSISSPASFREPGQTSSHDIFEWLKAAYVFWEVGAPGIHIVPETQRKQPTVQFPVEHSAITTQVNREHRALPKNRKKVPKAPREQTALLEKQRLTKNKCMDVEKLCLSNPWINMQTQVIPSLAHAHLFCLFLQALFSPSSCSKALTPGAFFFLSDSVHVRQRTSTLHYRENTSSSSLSAWFIVLRRKALSCSGLYHLLYELVLHRSDRTKYSSWK